MAGFACSAKQLKEVGTLLGNNATAAGLVCGSLNVTALGTTNAVLSWAISRLAQVEGHVNAVDAMSTDTKEGLDMSFVLTSSYIIFVMQAGFALYAAGVIRSKNTFNILMKNFIDATVAGVMFYLMGYAFAFGEKRHPDPTAPGGFRVEEGNGFIGTWDFALAQSKDPKIWSNFMFQWSFCAAAATIMSGAVAERVTFHSYLVYTTVFSTWVYPVLVHWLWSPKGWLSAFNPNPTIFRGVVDFAGSGVVHSLAGWASLVGAYAVGPRIGRFDPEVNPNDFKGRSASTYVLGTFLLWFGWYGFNPGSLQRISTKESGEIVGRIAVASTLAASMGSIVAAFMGRLVDKKWDLLLCCSGLLSGLVAVTGGCSVLPSWAAILVGAFAAVIYFYAEKLVDRLHIDDPVQAFAMHGCCGVFGLFWIGLFADKNYMRQVYGNTASYKYYGLIMGGGGRLLAAQLLAIAVIIAWATFWAALIFYTMKYLDILRVSATEEAMGIDVFTHGIVLDPATMNPHITKATQDTNTGALPAPELGTPHYIPPPGPEVESPVTLRMDTLGNMRWTPRNSSSAITGGGAMFRGGVPSSTMAPNSAASYNTLTPSTDVQPTPAKPPHGYSTFKSVF